VENLVARLTLTLIAMLTCPNTRRFYVAKVTERKRSNLPGPTRQRGDLPPRSHSGSVYSLRSPARVSCVLLVGLCLVPMTADAQVGQDRVLRQLPPNVWVKLQELPADASTQFVRQEHGGSCFDTKRGRLVLFGSNTHGRDWHNSPRFFDPAAAAWSQPYADDEFSTYAVNQEGIAVAGTNGDHPWTTHTFGTVVYDAARDEISTPSSTTTMSRAGSPTSSRTCGRESGARRLGSIAARRKNGRRWPAKA
jgi:hypothetical protein